MCDNDDWMEFLTDDFFDDGDSSSALLRDTLSKMEDANAFGAGGSDDHEVDLPEIPCDVEPKAPWDFVGYNADKRTHWDSMPAGKDLLEVPILIVKGGMTVKSCGPEGKWVLMKIFKDLMDPSLMQGGQVLDRIRERTAYTITGINSLQNAPRAGMWDAFQKVYKVEEMRTVYHGTNASAAKIICEDGFRGACSRRGLYGNGIYTSSNIFEALTYAEPSVDGTQTFLVVDLLQGPTVRGALNMVDFGTNEHGKKILTTTCPKNTIFCASHEDQLLVSYRVTCRVDPTIDPSPIQIATVQYYHPAVWRQIVLQRKAASGVPGGVQLQAAPKRNPVLAAPGASALPPALAAPGASVLPPAASSAGQTLAQLVVQARLRRLRVQNAAANVDPASSAIAASLAALAQSGVSASAQPVATVSAGAPLVPAKIMSHRGIRVGDTVSIQNSYRTHLFCDGQRGIVCEIVKDTKMIYCIQVIGADADLIKNIERANSRKFTSPGHPLSWVRCSHNQVYPCAAPPASSLPLVAPTVVVAATPVAAVYSKSEGKRPSDSRDGDTQGQGSDPKKHKTP